ncbi:MAG: hypothetical protein ACTSUM_01685 [Alphaproteobacteria bacterium]|nr:MAG: hypothetical protein B6I23_01645 [Rickettsiaceae bacterium 4572_127]
MTEIKTRISHQANGRIAELLVEIELLKRGWLVANINNSIKNALAFDIISVIDSKKIGIRVKSFQQKHHGAQYNAKENLSPFINLQKKDDFVIIVRKNNNETYDHFIIPTYIVDKQIKKDFNLFVSNGVKNGKWDKKTKTKEHKHRLLVFKTTRNKKGLEDTWNKYMNNWDILLK